MLGFPLVDGAFEGLERRRQARKDSDVRDAERERDRKSKAKTRASAKAERQQKIQFYQSLGKSPQVRQPVCSSLLCDASQRRPKLWS